MTFTFSTSIARLTGLVALTVFGAINSAQAQAPSLVVDASTGQVLVAEDATRPWNPASTTKMMTAYVALRMVKSGQVSLDTPLIASANAAGQKPSKLGIRPGQSITLDNALKVLMVKSANDVAVVIAEALGGSVSGFSAMMNAEARRLGMNESRFLNPHGFHAAGHQTSARDLALLAVATLRDFPEHTDYWGIGAVQMGNRVLNNTNGLIGRYTGANGFKTGFVCASGFNLVSMATRGGRTLIAVVLGASSGGERVVRSAQLLDQGFSSFGGGGQTLRSLPSSGYASAPDMRQAICTNRRRGVVLADDSDYGGAILADSTSGESMGAGSALAFFAGTGTTTPTRSYGIRSSGGRAILGPRQGVTPIAIYYGRAPGSTAVAMGPGGRRSAPAEAQPAATTIAAPARAGSQPVPNSQVIPGVTDRANALAPAQRTPAAAAAIAPKLEPQRAAPARTGRPAPAPKEEDDDADQPMQLPGLRPNPTTSAPTRPSSSAAIRPQQPATKQPAKKQPTKIIDEDDEDDKPAPRAKAKAQPKAEAASRSAPALRGVTPPARPQPGLKKKAAQEDDE